MRKLLFSLFLLFGLLNCKSVLAQQSISSPYSRFGLGDLNNTAFTAYSGMGSVNIAIADSFLLNPGNPASLAFIMPHRPIFDLGMSGQSIENRSATQSSSSSAMGLNNIALGFPINNRSGFAFGIMPYSKVGYKVVNVIPEDNIGDVTYTFNGSGGLNRIFLGFAYKIVDKSYNKLSLGINGNYLFGNIYRDRSAVYPSTLGLVHTKITHNTIVSDFLGDAGLLYRTRIKENLWVNIGATYSAGNKISARQELLAFSFRTPGLEYILDTIQYIDTTKGYLSLPRKIGYGISVDLIRPGVNSDNRRLVFSAQYETQDWAKYAEVFGNNIVEDNLENSSSMAFGFSFTPYTNSLIDLTKVNVFDITTYRVGFRYSKTYLQLNNTQLSQYGISFGATLPLIHSGSLTTLNLGFELGKRGTTDDNLLLENYFQFNVGFSIVPHRVDGWFYKRKFD